MRSARYCQAFTLAPFFSSAKLIGYLTFLTFILSGNAITAEIVFVTVALYNPVRLIMTLFIPFAVQIISETIVTINRLQVGGPTHKVMMSSVFVVQKTRMWLLVSS